MTVAAPSRRTASALRGASGFTLLEILVVIVIVGIMVSAATLSIGVLGGDRQAEDEARRLWAVLQQAREEAELQGMDVALFVSAEAYQFLRYDARQGEWALIEDDSFYRTRELPEGLRNRLWLDGREVVLRPQPPDRSDIEEHRKWPPQIMVLSSGEIMPFELQTERDRAPAQWRIVSAAENELRLERRQPRGRQNQGEWTVLAGARGAEDEEQSS
ncbi:MAG TPA: type II secretion system minor pseudopilin GspH [Steroidobacter sp.]|jgi:general secretion pathway protein H|nr:type II secretion system minor pseudopilin GspH [Steroidobacteraceae bacterium]HLS81814.1 type II secretion system minor pseudopilin GspH [Steroidobacter sp.]